MSRKKFNNDSKKGNAPWLNTFADLMNLLLCFFVLLFASSTIDAEKFEQISMSLANTFGILDGGRSSIGEEQMISSGIAQLNNLDEYMNNMGERNEKTEDKDFYEDGTTKEESNGQSPNSGSEIGEDEDDEVVGIDDALDKITKEMESLSEAMYDEMSKLATQYNLGDYMELSIDPQYQFVQLSLKGSILFDSGKADIKEEAKPILSRIGDILTRFNKYIIEIEGHTDNVPMTSPTFKDNNWLSSARALTTAEVLINSKKLNPAKIKYSGRGEYEPITSNDTSDGRAKNRRIEIKVYNEYSGR